MLLWLNSAMFSFLRSFGLVCVFAQAVLLCVFSQLVIFPKLFPFVKVLPVPFQCLNSASSKLTVPILLHFLLFS